MTAQELGNSVRSRRVALRLKQADVAEMAGTTPRTIFDIETGSGNPSIRTMLVILEVLGLSISMELKKPGK